MANECNSCSKCAQIKEHKGVSVCSWDYEVIKLPLVEVCEVFVTREEYDSWFNENKQRA